jgi:hypothetical protein
MPEAARHRQESDTIFDFSKLAYFDSVGSILLGHYVSVTNGRKVLILGQ